jgi:hypothetical protein
MLVDLDIQEIEQRMALYRAQPVIEAFDDMFLFGEWAYLFKDDRLLVSIHASVLANREDA